LVQFAIDAEVVVIEGAVSGTAKTVPDVENVTAVVVCGLISMLDAVADVTVTVGEVDVKISGVVPDATKREAVPVPVRFKVVPLIVAEFIRGALT
jgi:hypothetical protein